MYQFLYLGELTKLAEKKIGKMQAKFLVLAVTLSITQVFSQLVSAFLSNYFCCIY